MKGRPRRSRTRATATLSHYPKIIRLPRYFVLFHFGTSGTPAVQRNDDRSISFVNRPELTRE